MSSIWCPVLGAHVTRVTDLEGNVTRIIQHTQHVVRTPRGVNQSNRDMNRGPEPVEARAHRAVSGSIRGST